MLLDMGMIVMFQNIISNNTQLKNWIEWFLGEKKCTTQFFL